MTQTAKKLVPHLVLLLLLSVYICFSLVTYKHYGITSDEEIEYTQGKHLAQYLVNPVTQAMLVTQLSDAEWDQPSISPYYRIYTALFSLINTKGYYEIYHLLNMLFAALFLAVIYYVFLHLYKRPLLGVLAVLIIFLTPRFFGDIFANPKDMPFAVFYFISLCAIYLVADKKPSLFVQTLVLGALFGITQSLRVVGFTIYAVYIFYQIFTKVPVRQILASTILITITACFLMAVTWPYVGSNFFANLITLAREAKSFSHWDNTIFFNGQFLSKEARPQSYLFVWLLITTPVYILALFDTAPVVARKCKLYSLLWFALCLNSLVYLVAKPVIYNGLRHFLFLVPIISAIGFMAFAETMLGGYKRGVKVVVSILVGVGLLVQLVMLVRLHPYEYVYFNELIGGIKGAQDRFELDYWGASYKEATEWLREHKKTDLPRVYPCNLAFGVQYYAWGAFTVVRSEEEATYTMCDYDNDKRLKPRGIVIYTVQRLGTPLTIIRETGR